MSKFKVGDKVRSKSSDWTKDLIGEVVFANNWPAADVYFGKEHARKGWDAPGYTDEACWCIDDSELEAVSETPKAGSKFYVRFVRTTHTFDTLEEAEASAKQQAQSDVGETYYILQAVKAFKTSNEAQEVTLA